MWNTRLPAKLTATMALVLRLTVPAVSQAAEPDTNAISPLDSDWVVKSTLKSFEETEKRWNAGDTNLPLCLIQFFGPWDVVAHTTVNRDGNFRSGSFDRMGAKGWSFGQLDATNLTELQKLIDRLPPSVADLLPVRRRLLVSGIRSNSWFTRTYDRADVPPDLERICDLARGVIVWMPPSTSNTTFLAKSECGDHLEAVLVAAKIPLAIGICGKGITSWNLTNWGTSFLGPTNLVNTVWHPSAISPDGKTIILADWNKIIALDLPALGNRWTKTDPVERRDRNWLWGCAFLDKGQSIAVALADGVERWSAETGEVISVLGTSTVAYQRVIKASRNGEVLAADVGAEGQGRIQVWKSPWKDPPQELNLHYGWAQLMEISPDGRYLALRGVIPNLGMRLIICDLLSGTQTDMPFRGCYNREAYSAAWSPDGKYLVVGKEGQWPCVYETTTWKPILLWRIPKATQYWSGGPKMRVFWSPDGTLLANCDDEILRGLRFPVSEAESDRNFPTDK